MSVTLREKRITGGRVSLYLDFCHEGKRWFEFLKIYVNKNKPGQEDKHKKQLAAEIRIRREHELIVQHHGLLDRQKKRADFVTFFADFASSKKENSHRATTLNHLQKFVGERPLPIANLNTAWMKAFEEHLLKSVSENSTLTYLTNINAALNELVRKNIIASNPWHAVPRQERLKRKEVTRTAWTLEQLEQLANTPCNIDPQIRQAFLFSCFTGLRWSDVNKLEWNSIKIKNINGEEEWDVQFEQQKTAIKVDLPLSPEAIRILKGRKQETTKKIPGIYVFPGVKETCAKNKVVYRKVDYSLKKWAKASGLKEPMSFHTSRHSFATNLLEATNGDIYTVSKALGHKSVKTTEIYTQVRDPVKRKAARSLPMLNIIPPLDRLSAMKEAA